MSSRKLLGLGKIIIRNVILGTQYVPNKILAEWVNICGAFIGHLTWYWGMSWDFSQADIKVWAQAGPPPAFLQATRAPSHTSFSLGSSLQRKKEKCFSHLQASWEQSNGISCWIHLVLHRAQRQCWGKLVCLSAIVCLPFPHPSVWGLGSSVEALEQRDRERKTLPTLYVCKLSGVASVLFHALEKEMATHSSVLAWRIPGTGEPGGLPSLGSHRVRHDWSDLAAVAAAASVLKVAHGCWAPATQLCPFSLEARGRGSVLLNKSLACFVSWVAEEI